MAPVKKWLNVIRNRSWSAVALGLFALLLAIPFFIWFEAGQSLSLTSPETLAEDIRGLGGWAVAASIGMMVLCAASPLPAELVTISNGMIYGFGKGFLLSWGGAVIGAVVAFLLARLLGQPAVMALLSERHRHTLARLTRNHGKGVLFIARLIPLVPFFLINFAAGLSPMPLWTYVWVSALGMIPVTLLIVLFGDRLGALLF